MLDTEKPDACISPDTSAGPFMRLSPAAVERAKTKLGVDNVDDLSQQLGFSSRMTFWRARRGHYDIRLSHAVTIAQKIGWPLTRVFQAGSDA